MIALERGNKQDKPKLNMAEKCEISSTISIEGEAINHRNSMLLPLSFFRLKELFKVKNSSTT